MVISKDKLREYMRRLLLARLRLLCSNGFYGLLLMHVKFGLTDEVEHGGCGGDYIGFNPKFLDQVSDSELDYLLMHEILHLVLRHAERLGDREPERFNIACDIVVNSNILLSNGMNESSITLSSCGGVQPHTAPDGREGHLFTAEELYELLPNHKPTEPPQKGPGSQSSDDDSNSKRTKDGKSNCSSRDRDKSKSQPSDNDEVKRNDKNEDERGGNGGGKPSASGSGDDEPSAGDSGNEPSASDNGGGKPSAGGSGGGKPSASGNGGGKPGASGSGGGKPSASSIWERGRAKRIATRASDISVGRWDVHGHTGETEPDDTLREVWVKRFKDACEAISVRGSSNGRGLLPAFAKRMLEELRQPQTDWRTILNDFVQEDICDYSFTPPDRRFDGGAFFLPDFNEKEDLVKDILFMIDTSGSMSDAQITAAYSEIKGAIDQYNGKLKGWLGFFDAAIIEPQPFNDEEEFRAIRPAGGGGTDFQIIFEYVAKHMEDNPPASIIILTDGYAPFPQETLVNGIPTLWLINNDDVKPPWGKVARIKV